MENFTEFITADNSVTYYNAEYDELYHSHFGAYTEAMYKFVKPASSLVSNLPERIRILDLPFGLGYNSLCALEEFGNVEIIAIEKDPKACFLLLENNPGLNITWAEVLKSLKKNLEYKNKNAEIRLYIDDARNFIRDLDMQFDFVFLDPFSPKKNPELWTFDFFRKLYSILSDKGVIFTYSSALSVRSAFIRAGFHIRRTEPVGRKRGGTCAFKKPCNNFLNIEKRDNYLLKYSTGKIPYRDKKLLLTKAEILNYHEKIKELSVNKGILKTVKKSIKDYKNISGGN